MKKKKDKFPSFERERLTFWKKLGCFLIGFCPIDLIQHINSENVFWKEILVFNDIQQKQINGCQLEDWEISFIYDFIARARDEVKKREMYLNALLK
jgi:hypothetical protein